MKKKISFIIIFVILIIAYTIRLLYINNNTLAPELITYNIGEEVSIENDFFDNLSEKMNGYSLVVKDTNVISIDDFKSEYSTFENEMHADYIYLVKVVFKNNDNEFGESAGINLGQYILQKNSYINFPDKEAFQLINSIDSLMFSLRVNSEKELIIPFDMDTNYIDVKRLKSGVPSLVVSLYPHKKIIKLN